MSDWHLLAEHLAADLTKRGVLRDPAWRAALIAIPRHALVPLYFSQNGDATWRETTDSDPTYLEDVYSNKPLVTALASDTSGFNEPASSSSQPSLMIRMLESLKLHSGDRVLEIGTGTGYNAALLSHRLGERNVYSVDIDEHLIEDARRRLRDIGYSPSLAAIDGALGWPEHGSYSKIIATCSVPVVPWTWAAQTEVGGQVLVDIKIGPSAGNLALLDRLPDRLEGRFLPQWATFMTIRRRKQPESPIRDEPDYHVRKTRTTGVDPEPWNNLVVWFLARFRQPPGLNHGVTLNPDTGRPAATFLSAPDGSWCEISHDGDQQHIVREAGPTPLWSPIEAADRLWRAVGQPGWDRFGLTVTRDHQDVWLDSPEEPEHRWSLPRASRTPEASRPA
jgi:protein-L-isoaspartate O-methyltransferase